MRSLDEFRNSSSSTTNGSTEGKMIRERGFGTLDAIAVAILVVGVGIAMATAVGLFDSDAKVLCDKLEQCGKGKGNPLSLGPSDMRALGCRDSRQHGCDCESLMKGAMSAPSSRDDNFEGRSMVVCAKSTNSCAGFRMCVYETEKNYRNRSEK